MVEVGDIDGVNQVLFCLFDKLGSCFIEKRRVEGIAFYNKGNFCFKIYRLAESLMDKFTKDFN
jgi:hypothetical protein